MTISNIFRFLEDVPDINVLASEVQEVMNGTGISTGQIMCQGLHPDVSDWTTGAGHLTTLENQTEQDYRFINPSLAGTTIERYINKYNAFRTRIMIMPGRHCYSVHRDLTARIHIPIITNPQAWMVWPNVKECQHLTRGSSYWTNTKAFHTFFNGAEEIRVHLVFCVDN